MAMIVEETKDRDQPGAANDARHRALLKNIEDAIATREEEHQQPPLAYGEIFAHRPRGRTYLNPRRPSGVEANQKALRAAKLPA